MDEMVNIQLPKAILDGLTQALNAVKQKTDADLQANPEQGMADEMVNELAQRPE